MAIGSTAAAIIGGVGSVAGGLLGASGSKSAANTAAAAADRAAELQYKAAENVRADLAPYNQAGQAATNRLMSLFGLAPTAAPAATAPAAAAPAATTVAPFSAPSSPDATRPLAYGEQQGDLPAGYRYIPPSWTSDESGQTYNPGMIVDGNGNYVSQGENLPLARQEAQFRGVDIPVANAQPAPQPAPAQPGPMVNAGALPGPDSAVTPYAAPNGGVFDPQGGAIFYRDPNFTQFSQFLDNTQFNLTPEQLAQTPGYQFVLDQGTRALNNSAAARGGLMSGRAVKEGIKFATGLADNTYMNQAQVFGQNYARASDQFSQNYARASDQFANNFARDAQMFGDNYNRQQNLFGTNLNTSIALNDQYYNRNISPLFDLAKMGAAAGAQTGQAATDSAKAAGGFINTGGATQAAAEWAGTKSMVNAFNQGGNNLLYSMGRGWLQPDQSGAVDTGTWDQY